MRAALVAATMLFALGACGGSSKPAKKPQTPEQKACGRYGVRIAPFLDRFGAALDVYDSELDQARDGAARGEAARKFADFIAGELDGVRRIAPHDPTLGPAHDRLIYALEEVAGGMDQLATAYALGDDAVHKRALARIGTGFTAWSSATRVIVTQCRD